MLIRDGYLTPRILDNLEELMMESKEIYQESYNTLVGIRKSIGDTKLVIDFDKLDANSKEEIRSAIMKVTGERQSAILTVLGNTMSGV